jgi:4-diphosphocytidyl-2-C-methyl-D-erythritol kinase
MQLARSLGNVLQPVSEDMRPPIREAIDALKAQGAITALMTGSGSVVFGLFSDEETAQAAAEKLSHRGKTFLARPVTAGVKILSVE